ncbi:sensor domain-containing diguanylate cyclase [Rheinheimera riviphila]|uniref:sensor domain-containing diguanylate cyclase n=1 Tax=Rheinheimera riviphila TaxID=1834037 RepID=UPI00198044C7|nr:sensor domain-containing diguanylate cyclase [Rheinheimera riviphila]
MTQPSILTPKHQTDLPDSLVVRLTRLNNGILALTLTFTFTAMAATFWFGSISHQQHNALASAQVLASSIAPALIFSDPKSAQLELQTFSRATDVLAVQVLHMSQVSPGETTIFVQWQQPEWKKTLTPPTIWPQQANVVSGWQQYQIQMPIMFKQEQVGLLLVQQSLKSLQQQVMALIALMGLITLLMLALASRGLRLVQQRALSPIIELSALAEQAARDNDYSVRGIVRRHDEVGRLTERINELFTQVAANQFWLKQQLADERQTGQQLKQLAHHDSLTGLPNRLYFQQQLSATLQLTLQQHKTMALMFIDLDNFKTVNDSFGHDYGDEVLQLVSARMQQVLRGQDLLCRLGGDEFAVLLSELNDIRHAESLAERLIAAVRLPMVIREHLMPVGATIGLAFCPLDASEPATLLQKADEAMYAAKRAGKNTFRRVQHAP